MKIIVSPKAIRYLTFNFATAISIYPFIILKYSKDRYGKNYETIINHEKIHLKQQKELFIIPFYFLYLLFYIINFIKFFNHTKAYFNIPFEDEAYKNDKNLSYPEKRKKFSWIY